MSEKGTVILAVCGVKNSGKTTLLCGIIPILRQHGLRVAAIKHDGHDFEPDVPGADSDRLRKAGAYGTAVYSENRYMLTAEQKGTDVESLAMRFPDADVILLEGGKASAYPKIEIVRSRVSNAPICDAGTLLALCTDLELEIPGVPTLPIGDYAGVARILIDYLRKEGYPCLTSTEGK